MKSEKGVTLTSLIIYVIAMIIIVGTITVMTKYFYGNLNYLTNENNTSKAYTDFTSYFITEINTKGNSVAYCDDNQVIVFSNGNQYTFKDNGIYFNKIKICSDVESCTFSYDKKVTVTMQINGKNYNNVYTLMGE